MLSEVLYYVFIFPLEQVLDWSIGLFYSFIGSLGVSIILLSLCVNGFLLKLSLFFDKKAQKFNALKKSCDSKIAEFKRVFKGAELNSYVRTLYKQRHFHPIYALGTLGGLALQIPFFIAIYLLVSHVDYFQGVSFLYIQDLSKPDSLGHISSKLAFVHLLPVAMTLLTLVNVFYSFKDRAGRIQGVCIAIIFLILLYSAPSVLVLYWTTNVLFSLCKSVCKNTFFSQTPTSHSLTSLQNDNRGKVTSDSKIYQHISMLAIINICFMICVFTPFAVYSSDVSQFDATQTLHTLCALFGIFLLSSSLLIYLSSFLYKAFIFKFSMLKLMSYGLSVILCIGVVYTFVLVGDYGAMDNFILQKLSFANAELRVQKYLYAFLTFIGSVGFVFFMGKRLKPIMGVLSVSLIVLSSVSLYAIGTESKTEQNLTYQGEAISYAKNDKNIVIFMLDAFSGSHMPSLLAQFPEFKTSLDGFVLFDNALASGDATSWSVPAILGGRYYANYNIAQREGALWEHMVNAFSNVPLSFAENGYDVSLYMVPLAMNHNAKSIKQLTGEKVEIHENQDEFAHFFINELSLQDSLIEALHEEKHYEIIQLSSFGLFRFSPELFFRPRIYNNGFWLFKSDGFGSHATNTKLALAYASRLYALTHLGDTNASKPTFKFFHTLMTHPPFALSFANNKCEFFAKGSAWQDSQEDPLGGGGVSL
ncbi:YidC/Oxa1 family membrane protein insertase [Helicobacter marmotae]|uniref:YidC/Oxa1 family membrane protein insertase n=2 Tax=Helicobacter marmotae TaxID=152490 RepID=UPI001FD120EA|nr:YidC/Oxa1 family membrane protein insertase [Helicobacter marmotae]